MNEDSEWNIAMEIDSFCWLKFNLLYLPAQNMTAAEFHNMDVCVFSCDWKNISLWNLTRSWEKVSAGPGSGQWPVWAAPDGGISCILCNPKTVSTVYLKVNAFLCISFITHCDAEVRHILQWNITDRLGSALCLTGYLRPMTCPNEAKTGHKAIMIPWVLQ